jgi:hypothetical protein
VAHVGVLALAAINCVVLYFTAFLAAGGDGSASGVRTVWLFGYFWIAAFTAASLVLCARGKGSVGVLTAASTLPTAYVAGFAAVLGGSLITDLKSSSSAFQAACKTAGVQFVATPATSVQSIAYDWGREYPVEINYFQLGSNGRVSSVEVRNPPYPIGIAFTESKTTELLRDGTRSEKIVRVPRDGNPQRATALAADVLVSYQYTNGVGELSKALSQQGLVGYEMTVLDLRDNRELAKLRYFTDLVNNRACGPTDGAVLNTRTFVLKAVGMW